MMDWRRRNRDTFEILWFDDEAVGSVAVGSPPRERRVRRTTRASARVGPPGLMFSREWEHESLISEELDTTGALLDAALRGRVRDRCATVRVRRTPIEVAAWSPKSELKC